MKTILVLTGGSETDEAVLASALAVAKPLGAHLEFLHVRIGAAEAAQFTPHVEFVSGAALRNALAQLEQEAEARSVAAKLNVRRFCERHAIEMTEVPAPSARMSASWREERDDAVDRMIAHARHNDLVVTARTARANGLPRSVVEQLLVACGRPVVIAPSPALPGRRAGEMGTVMVCWKESAAAARALGAALPLLAKARRVVIVGVEESAASSEEAIRAVVRHLAWHGIAAAFELVPADGRSAAERLRAIAERIDADLLVMGGYGHARIREMVFGGCTQSFLDGAERPVLMMH